MNSITKTGCDRKPEIVRSINDTTLIKMLTALRTMQHSHCWAELHGTLKAAFVTVFSAVSEYTRHLSLFVVHEEEEVELLKG